MRSMVQTLRNEGERRGNEGGSPVLPPASRRASRRLGRRGGADGLSAFRRAIGLRGRVGAVAMVLFAVVLVVGLPAGGAQEEGGAPHEETSAEHEHAEEHGHEEYDAHVEEHDEHGEGGDHEGVHVEAVDLAEGERLHVVATTSIVGDVVSNVAGDAAEVTVLMPIGQNPHAWEPTPRAMAAVETADIVFVNGLDLEENLMKAIDQRDTGAVVAVSHGVEVLPHPKTDAHEDAHGGDGHGEDHGHAHLSGDPHTWFSPLNVMIWVENIEHAFAAADPDRAGRFAGNAEEYREKLDALDAEMRDLFGPIPDDARKLVIDHAALGYFARDYGFQILGAVIPSTTDQAEPSAHAVAELIKTVESESVPAIFVGGTASRGLKNLVDTVAQEVEREITVHTLLTGSLTPPGTPGDTYLGFTRYNAGEIAEGLTE